MGMLVFQIERIASQGQPLDDGVYEVPLRVIDDGDCLSTILLAGAGSPSCPDACLSAKVLSPRSEFALAETGRAVASALADVERFGSPGGEPRGGAVAERVRLTLLRYELSGPCSMSGLWVLQRELRRRGMDICVDESAVLVGYAERIGDQGREKLSLNLVGRFDRLSDRDGVLIDRSALQKKTVLVVGLGSVGSGVASDLARCGVGKFIVADGERLEWGNVVRHAAGLSDVGRLKSRIVADLIKDRNPYADVWGVSTELASASKDTYEKAIASADVVICATDSRASRLICNRLCVKHRKRVIFGGLTGGAYSGMVFQCQSPGTMCYHCFVSLFPETAADRESNESAYSGGPDGHLALDIGPITNLMAKLALVELQKQVGVVAGGLDGDLTHPWYLWINRRDGEYAEVATPLGAGGGGPEILRWYPLPMEKFEGCPHCGTGPG